MGALKTALGILIDAAIGACLYVGFAALGLFGVVISIVAWIFYWKRPWHFPSATDYLEGPGEVRLRQVYKGPCPNIAVAESEIEFLSRVLKCPACRFNDEGARCMGKPWCSALEPPRIESFKCQDFVKA